MFGGFGQQQQQQQQQPTQPQGGGLFGGGGAFGAQPAQGVFGQQQTSPFGQQQAPAFGQQQAAPAFGQQQAGGFGGFGGQQAQATPAFGTPASGGIFGGTPAAPAANSGFSFGGTANSVFGAPKTSAAPTTSLFGAKPATTFGGGFGAPAQPAAGGLFGGGAPAFGAAPAPGQGGTAIVPFRPTQETPTGRDNANGEVFMHQSISCMDAYKNFSFEELRLQDYQANRKFPTAAATPSFGGSFGQVSQPAFGATAPATFGAAGSVFGQQQPAATPAFGAAPGQGLFGAQQPAFGQQAPSIFGTPAPAQGGGLFGGGAFGQSQAPAAQAAPAFGGFGAKPAATGAFSFGATSQAPAAGGLFGAPQQQQQPAFGQQSAAPAAGGLFGAQPAAPGGFSFGAKPAGLFGAPAPTSAPAFGAPKPTFSFGQQQPAASAPGGLFGQPAQSPFGAPAPAAGGLFGSTTASPFGQPQQQPAAPNQFGGGLFGAKPATSAPAFSFGAPAPTMGGSLFGNSQPAQQQQQPSNLFGGQSTLGGSFNGGLSTASQPQQVAYAVADDVNAYGSNPLFANSASPVHPPVESQKKQPIFASFRGTPVNRSSTKITRLRGFGPSASASPVGSAARGSPLSFGASVGAGGQGGGPGGGRSSPLRLVNGIGDDAALSPNAFVSRPSVKKLVIDRSKGGINDSFLLGSPRAGSSTSGAGEATKSGGEGGTGRAKVAFNPEVDTFSRERSHFAQSNGGARNGGDDYPNESTPVKKSAGSHTNLGESSGLVRSDSGHNNENVSPPDVGRATANPPPTSTTPLRPPKEGEYYTIPSLTTLQKLPAVSLQSLPDLVVGRVGYGEVAFRSPVDLTTLSSVHDLLGSIIVFEDRNCTVYPSDYEGKPPLGQGLNVPATITLERCWPLDKATRKPITDKEHPRLVAHVKRLRNLEDTEFIDFETEGGKWIFGVKGF